MMVHPFGKLFLANFISLYIKKIEGKNYIPKDPFIAVSNHASFADDLIIPSIIVKSTNKKIRTYVNSRFYKSAPLKIFLDHYGCIPVDVGKDVKEEEKRKKTNQKAFKLAKQALKEDKNVIIFPEGGRSHDGKLKKGKVGAAKLALAAKVPVLPIGIRGSYDILPKGAKFPRFKRATVHIGKPLTFSTSNLEEITGKIMTQIQKLSQT